MVDAHKTPPGRPWREWRTEREVIGTGRADRVTASVQQQGRAGVIGKCLYTYIGKWRDGADFGGLETFFTFFQKPH